MDDGIGNTLIKTGGGITYLTICAATVAFLVAVLTLTLVNMGRQF